MNKSASLSGRQPQIRHATLRPSTRPLPIGSVNVASKGVIAPRKLQCFSVACIDMPQLEFGDKVVLPAKVLLELQCFKVATPMLFQIRAYGARVQDANSSFAQYCSVQEFSAPDGQVFIPYWMMENLRLTEGNDVVITNVADIPRGIYCRLQPEDTLFLDIAAEIGPKLLMESALRRYSVLSVNETILIDHGDRRFYVKVLELKPGNVVSLLGDVDLEMDFAAPPQADRKRPTSAIDRASTEQLRLDGTSPHEHHQDTGSIHHLTTSMETAIESMGLGLGRRLGDGACVVAPEPAAPVAVDLLAKRNEKLGTSSFRAAEHRIQASGSSTDVVTDRVAAKADTDSLAGYIKLAQGAFSSEGHRLGGRIVALGPPNRAANDSTSCVLQESRTQQNSLANESLTVCDMCLAEITLANMTLHKVRCSRNPSYHRFKCLVCHDKVFKRDQQTHLHCPQCDLHTNEAELASHIIAVHAATHACADCGLTFTRVDLEDHCRRACPHGLELCKLCGFKLKRKEMPTHTVACSSRTNKCEICLKYVKIVDLDAHVVACSSDRELTTPERPTPELPHLNNQLEELNPAPRSDLLECVYCAKRTFADTRQLDRHVNQECLTARKFCAPALSTKLPLDAAGNTVKVLIQGKLKRREDANVLHQTASALKFDVSVLHQRNGNQRETLLVHSSNPLVRATPSDRSSGLMQTTRRRQKAAYKQPPRPPVQLASLPIKPPKPELPQLDSATDLFVGNGTVARSQPRAQINAHGGATFKLQAMRRP